jgi:hypothetical protein
MIIILIRGYFEELYEDTDKESRKIAALMKYLNASEIKGLKFKDRVKHE